MRHGLSQQDSNDSSTEEYILTAARRAVAAAEQANEAAKADPKTPVAVKELLGHVLEESRSVLAVAETASPRKTRQSFAEFTSLLGEEVKESAEQLGTEGIKVAHRTLRQAKSLIEDHFHIDEAFRMLGPLRHTDSNLARDVHDWFNLVALLPVIYLNLRNWECLTFCNDTLFSLRQRSMPELWHGQAFEEFWWTTLAYFITDIMFVKILPHCVKSPGVILQHHVATIGYICIPKFRPQYGWLMGACMIVEVNTWFLIARRSFNKAGDKAFCSGVSFLKSLRLLAVSTCFYISWFVIRLIIYPYLLVVIMREWLKESQRVGTYFNVIGITPIMQCIFIFLNVKWTIDLLRSKLKGRGASKGL